MRSGVANRCSHYSSALTTFISYLINHRWTFALKDGKVSGRETASFVGVNAVAYAVSAGIMAVTQRWFGPLSRLGEDFVLILTGFLPLNVSCCSR